MHESCQNCCNNNTPICSVCQDHDDWSPIVDQEDQSCDNCCHNNGLASCCIGCDSTNSSWGPISDDAHDAPTLILSKEETEIMKRKEEIRQEWNMWLLEVVVNLARFVALVFLVYNIIAVMNSIKSLTPSLCCILSFGCGYWAHKVISKW